MTLREKLQATADFHAGTNWMLYLSQLENILAETADDDAERVWVALVAYFDLKDRVDSPVGTSDEYERLLTLEKRLRRLARENNHADL